MIIREFYINEDNGGLYVEFSTKKDGDDFYRVIEFNKEDIEYYSPTILDDDTEIDEEFITELILEYSKNNELPEEEML
jgi:hypothetical protein